MTPNLESSFTQLIYYLPSFLGSNTSNAVANCYNCDMIMGDLVLYVFGQIASVQNSRNSSFYSQI